MPVFFGDERKYNTKEKLSMLLYRVHDDNMALISSLVKDFKKQNNLSLKLELHFYDNTRIVNKLFSDFIIEKLLLTAMIEKIYHVQVPLLPEPASHILALQEMIIGVAIDLDGLPAQFVIDKLGGKNSETEIKTQFGRLCRHHNIKLKKTLVCEDSSKSEFIQIADYLVAMKDKNII